MVTLDSPEFTMLDSQVKFELSLLAGHEIFEEPKFHEDMYRKIMRKLKEVVVNGPSEEVKRLDYDSLSEFVSIYLNNHVQYNKKLYDDIQHLQILQDQ